MKNLLITSIRSKKVNSYLYSVNQLIDKWLVSPQDAITLSIIALQHILEKEISIETNEKKEVEFKAKSY